MQVVLLRVGIDTGSGGIHGPLFRDNSFEFLWIPDKYNVEQRTYSSVTGRYGRKLIEYFPPRRRPQMERCPVHADPEFDTFTYGDPTQPKAGLRRLQPGDYLAFYCGLQGWNFESAPALYLIGYFHVQLAGLAASFQEREIKRNFAANAHVRHKKLYYQQKEKLVLVKGSESSHFFRRAVKISEPGLDRAGQPMPILSKRMQTIFGNFDGRVCIKRSPPRWVAPELTKKAVAFLKSCE